MTEHGPGNEDFWISHLDMIGRRINEGGYLANFYTHYLITESNPPPNYQSLSRRMTFGIFAQSRGDDRVFFPVFAAADEYQKDLGGSALIFLALLGTYAQSLNIPMGPYIAARKTPILTPCDIHNEPVTFAYFGYERAQTEYRLPDQPFIMVSTMPGYTLGEAIHDLLLMGMSAIDQI